MDKLNRIFFKDNPYPNGHKIKEFVWSGRFESETGIWFDFHLETEDYYAEDESFDEEIEPQSDWEAKIVWGNYHSCILSSTYWGDGGILVGSSENKLDFEELEGTKLIADKLPLPENWDDDDFSFYIYLLGHDSCADHEIKFIKKHTLDTFDIEWKGKIALTYAGQTEFEYEFSAFIEKAQFKGIDVSKSVNSNLDKYVVNPNLFGIKEKMMVLKNQ